jgi:hypothetical protein
VGKNSQRKGQIDEQREDFIERPVWDGKMHDFGRCVLPIEF